MDTVNERIKAARERAGLSQTELASQIGRHLRTVQNMEREGWNVKLADAQAIAEATGVPEKWILKGEGPIGDSAREDVYKRILALIKEYDAGLESSPGLDKSAVLTRSRMLAAGIINEMKTVLSDSELQDELKALQDALFTNALKGGGD